MVDAVTVARLLGGVVLLLANGFFVTTEFAMTRVRQFDEAQFRGRGLERAWEMSNRLEIYLSGCQVGITVSSVGLGVVAEPAVTALIDPLVRAVGLAPPGSAGHTAASVALALGAINIMHIIVGEQAPTYLGVERTRLVAKYGAPLLYWWTRLMWPVIVVADRISKTLLRLFGVEITRSWTAEEVGEEAAASRSELRRQMGDALSRAGLTSERQQEVLNALAIGDMLVTDVMVDRENVVALSTADDPETNLRRIREHSHVRFPLVGEDFGDFEGIVYTPGLLREYERLAAGEIDLSEVAAPPMTVPAATPVSDVIDQFQAERQELALVLDGGEVVGLVTLTDCFEAIAGQLEDPLDELGQ